MNRYCLLLVLAMIFIGSNVGVGKSIVRFVIALAVLWPFLRPARMRRVKRDEWFNLFLQALFGTFGFTLLMLGGVHRTSAVAAGVITSTIPAVVALFSWLILRERPDGRTLASIGLAVTGIAVINLAHADTGGAAQGSFTGNLMVLGAVCCESLYIILSRRISQTLEPFDICAYTHLFGFALMLPFGLPAALSFDYTSVPAGVWALLVWYGLSASVFSFCLWMMGIRHVPGSVAGVITAVLPVAAALYGMAFLGERPTAAHGVALACVVAGIALASLRTRRTPPVAS